MIVDLAPGCDRIANDEWTNQLTQESCSQGVEPGQPGKGHNLAHSRGAHHYRNRIGRRPDRVDGKPDPGQIGFTNI